MYEYAPANPIVAMVSLVFRSNQVSFLSTNVIFGISGTVMISQRRTVRTL